MADNKFKVCVVGCGVIGLSTAIAIQQQRLNVHVTIVADKISPDTTSDGAAGFWEPLLEEVTPQENKLREWMLGTRQHTESLVRSSEAGEAGVTILSGYYLSNSQDKAEGLSELYYGCRKLDANEMTALFPNYINGWFVTAFQTECRKYLPWLMNNFQKAGGNLIKRRISHISEIANEYDVFVNCTGLAAKEFINDESVYPVRGQLLRVKAPWLKHFIIDIDCSDSYIIPCRDAVVLGGTYQENNWKLEIDAKDRMEILRKCSKMFPSIVNSEVMTEWVGLRPARSTVRLERECLQIGDKMVQVIHNYGHGGRGITLHWGCAVDAAQLVQDIIHESTKRTKAICKL